MFNVFKSSYVQNVERASQSCAEIFTLTLGAFGTLPQGELMSLMTIPKEYFRSMRDRRMNTSNVCYENLEKCEQLILEELNSGAVFGLMNVVLAIVFVTEGFKETPTKTANRIIQELYKMDVPRFSIEGKSYSNIEIASVNFQKTSRSIFDFSYP